MDFDDYKLTAAERLANGVVAAPDKLTGTAQQNKALFDRLISGDGLFADKYNSLLSALKSSAAAAAIGAEDADGRSTTVQALLDAITGSMIKVFELSDYSDLETAQEAFEWLKAGKYPVLKFNGEFYFAYSLKYTPQRTFYDFTEINNIIFTTDLLYGYDTLYIMGGYRLTVSEGTVTGISTAPTSVKRFIEPGVDYTMPYTPQYDGSPATKKYVDDAVAGVTGVKWAEHGVTTFAQITEWVQDGYLVVLNRSNRFCMLTSFISNSNLKQAIFSSAFYIFPPLFPETRGHLEITAIENENGNTEWSVGDGLAIPKPTQADAGKVLTVNSTGSMEWMQPAH